MREWLRLPGWARGVGGVLVFLLATEAFGRAGVINRAVLPLASTVLARAAGLAVSGRFLADVAATAGAWALGLAIAEANTGAGNTSLVLAAALSAGLLGLAANAVLVWGERRVLRWHHSYSLELA
jgi:ABC-type nitrate/sulfonate/bicarbonate transport system permease component